MRKVPIYIDADIPLAEIMAACARAGWTVRGDRRAQLVITRNPAYSRPIINRGHNIIEMAGYQPCPIYGPIGTDHA
jgi:hypothetical protein